MNQAVEATKANPKTKAQANFINACLRRFLREREALVATTEVRQEARWNHPLWWIQRVRAEQPERWQSVLAAANCHPPMALRVNARKSTPAAYAELLHEQGVEVRRVTPTGAELAKAVPVHALPHFDQGFASVQDGAAQMAAPLLLQGEPLSTEARILDACAAPGGKTAHLRELTDAQVLALEVDPVRAARITQTLERLGLHASVQVADAGMPPSWWDGHAFDRILLDAPCTASGIVRRHPDIRWLRRKADTLQLATLSGKILDNLWQMLAPGGKLLFVTCSLWPQESEAQAAAFAVRNQAVRLDAPGQLLPPAPRAGSR